ncbi:MAG: alpha/beta hydrolase fold domain-containing protein [Pseudomonadota bacterium]
MMRILTLLLGPLLLTACASGPGDPNQPPYAVGVTRDLAYTPDDWPETLRADIHYPETSAENQHAGVLMVHGGGWEYRSRADMSDTANELAREGFVVMNIDHRFAPEYRFPAQLHDLQIAMRWFRENSAEYDLDPERIGAWGFSSGAHLVSMLGVVSGKESPLNEPWGGAELEPKAVVAGGLPADFDKFEGGRRLEQLLGVTYEEDPQAHRKASPIHHVHAGAPPFFLFHGTWDGLVPIDHAEDFSDALTENGVEAQLYRLWLRGHVLSFLFNDGATAEAADFLDASLNGDSGS